MLLNMFIVTNGFLSSVVPIQNASAGWGATWGEESELVRFCQSVKYIRGRLGFLVFLMLPFSFM